MYHKAVRKYGKDAKTIAVAVERGLARAEKEAEIGGLANQSFYWGCSVEG